MDRDVKVLFLGREKILFILEREKPVVVPGKGSFLKRSMWGLPGGRSEPEDNDDEIRTAIREVRHEIGIVPEIENSLRVEEWQGNHLKIMLVGYLPSGKMQIDPTEIIEARWRPEDLLYNDSFPMYIVQRRMAQELLRKLRR